MLVIDRKEWTRLKRLAREDRFQYPCYMPPAPIPFMNGIVGTVNNAKFILERENLYQLPHFKNIFVEMSEMYVYSHLILPKTKYTFTVQYPRILIQPKPEFAEKHMGQLKALNGQGCKAATLAL